MDKAEFEAWLDDDASLYELCEDPECPVAYAFVWPPERHYHPKTSAQGVCAEAPKLKVDADG